MPNEMCKLVRCILKTSNMAKVQILEVVKSTSKNYVQKYRLNFVIINL
jgi:hypothetical protein